MLLLLLLITAVITLINALLLPAVGKCIQHLPTCDYTDEYNVSTTSSQALMLAAAMHDSEDE